MKVSLTLCGYFLTYKNGRTWEPSVSYPSLGPAELYGPSHLWYSVILWKTQNTLEACTWCCWAYNWHVRIWVISWETAFYYQFVVVPSCPTLCHPMNCRMLGSLVLHCLPEFPQTYAHWVGDAIQPSHPLLLSSPFAPNLSQHIRAWFWELMSWFIH